jgi:hypothetical protein
MLRGMAAALTAETRLIVVLKDPDWSDYSTVDLISHLARRRGPARLLVIGTFRPAEPIVKRHQLCQIGELQAATHALARPSPSFAEVTHEGVSELRDDFSFWAEAALDHECKI